MKFSERINSALAQANKSQTDLAAHMSVTPQAVQQWCKEGGTMPRPNKLEKIAKFLDVDYSWLATGYSAANTPNRDTVISQIKTLTRDEKIEMTDMANRIAQLDDDKRETIQKILDSWEQLNER